MKNFLVVAFCLSSAVSFAQIENRTAPAKPFIEVTGTAIKEVIPDEISISIKLSDKVVNNDDYLIEAQEDSLKILINRLNIDMHNLVLADASSVITREKRKKSEFKVTKQYTLQVKNANEVSKVFRGLFDMEIKEVVISKLEHSKIDSFRRDVRIAAIKAAKDKAEYLLTAIGEQLDAPLEIREEQMPMVIQQANLYNYNFKSREQMDDVAKNNNAGPDFENITIKFSYYIKYAIK